jgi:hypothetical protein
MALISNKVARSLLAGCTVVLKCSPEAPGEGYLIAEIAEAVGLPPGVLNVLTADREVSELLVRDPRVDKITFTGSRCGATQPRVANHLCRQYGLCAGSEHMSAHAPLPAPQGPGKVVSLSSPRARASIRSILRASNASRYPLAARARAVAAPIPDDAPVMTATRPLP